MITVFGCIRFADIVGQRTILIRISNILDIADMMPSIFTRLDQFISLLRPPLTSASAALTAAVKALNTSSPPSTFDLNQS